MTTMMNIVFYVCMTLAFLDCLYYVSSMAFVWGWGEGRPSSSLLRRFLVRLAIWGCTSCLLFYFDDLVKQPQQSPLIFDWILPLLFMGIMVGFFIHNICFTRRQIVNGGPPPSSVVVPQWTTKVKASTRENKSNRTFVITGANTGIGKETVRQILAIFVKAVASTKKNTDDSESLLECQIYLLCRSISKGNQAITDILRQVEREESNIYNTSSTSIRRILQERCTIQVIPCDLSSFQSVRLAAQTLLEKTKKIDVLINNAGVMMKDMVHTVDGIETCLQANALGHFLLTTLLLPQIRNPGGRIINVTSSTYRLAIPTFHPDKLDQYAFFKNKNLKQQYTYTLFGQYAATKWIQILHTRYLYERLHPNIFTAAVHPGLVRTDVVRNMPWYLRIPNTVFAMFVAALQKSPAAGAWGTIHAIFCEDPDDDDGALLYWVNRKPQALIVQDDAIVQKQAEQVWNWCCETVLTKTERQTLEQYFLDCKKIQNKTK